MDTTAPRTNTVPVGIRRLIRNNEGLKLSIPRYAANACGWNVGDYIAVVIQPDDTLTLQRVPMPATPTKHRAATA